MEEDFGKEPSVAVFFFLLSDCFSGGSPTKYFTSLEPTNLPIDVSGLHKTRRWADFPALKIVKGSIRISSFPSGSASILVRKAGCHGLKILDLKEILVLNRDVIKRRPFSYLDALPF